jgi:hypothetical protein
MLYCIRDLDTLRRIRTILLIKPQDTDLKIKISRSKYQNLNISRTDRDHEYDEAWWN